MGGSDQELREQNGGGEQDREGQTDLNDSEAAAGGT
jgi:hypothetical protein